MLNILVIGSGAREHALCYALAQDAAVKNVYCAPGNGGIPHSVPIDWRDREALHAFCLQKDITFVLIGPEGPLAAGLASHLPVVCFGPSAQGAQLEASKSFTKTLCRENAIPTAQFEILHNSDQARGCPFLKTFPVVVKEDGLAAGKGVTIVANQVQLDELLQKVTFPLVVEEYLTGVEISFFVLCYETMAIPLGFWRDHKRAFDGNLGPNTGGMGAYGPIEAPRLEAAVLETIIHPTLKAMSERGTPFKGLLYAGLMLTECGPKLIEYNVRFGDPETQVLALTIAPHLGQWLYAIAQGKRVCPQWRPETKAVTVVMANKGYPAEPEVGHVIAGLDEASRHEGVMVFHAGTRLEASGHILATGGRVLAVSAIGKSFSQARARAYGAVQAIHWPGCFYRTDIGLEADRAQGLDHAYPTAH